jgi:homoserine kinase
MKEEINILEVSAPATVANLSCGFDILGLCLNHEADVFTLTKTESKGIRISKIVGADLSSDLQQNVAGVASTAIWEQLPIKPDFGIEVTIHKKMAVGSGLGSSAASAAAIVVGINKMCGNPFDKKELVFFAMQGEKLVSGQAHADNVAPAIYGGITAVTSYEPFFVQKLPTPKTLYMVILHPKCILKTSEARAILPKTLTYKQASTQMGHLSNFICGLYESNEKLMQLGLKDILVEPYRKDLIPGFEAFKEAAMKENCLGFGISGAGPSMFAMCSHETTAQKIQENLIKTAQKLEIHAHVFISQINPHGVQYKILK